MEREQIIRMAREAGAMFDHMTWVERDLAPVFERFAALIASRVAAAEREACAQICDSVNSYDNPMTANDVAAAIRARGQS